MHYICIRIQATRALSSAGSEHLVYTQRVGGSNPSAPTRKRLQNESLFISPNLYTTTHLPEGFERRDSGFVT